MLKKSYVYAFTVKNPRVTRAQEQDPQHAPEDTVHPMRSPIDVGNRAGNDGRRNTVREPDQHDRGDGSKFSVSRCGVKPI